MRLYIFLLIIGGFSCNTQVKEKSNDLASLKAILASQRTAHLNKDASLLISNTNDPLLEISGGKVNRVTAADGRKGFEQYLNSVEFVKWDDIAEPIFHFSDDSTMATVTVQKLVILKEHGATRNDTTNFAWTSVYRKQNNQWKMMVITSTNK
jgi:hypothetical protein